MSNTIGTVVRGIKAPIIRIGDNLPEIIIESITAAAEAENFSFKDRDIVAITEAVVARAQGNYAKIDDIADDIKTKYPNGHIGVIFPILSRNRFAICLKGVAKGAKKITLMLSYPSDEVGNHLIDTESLDAVDVNPWTDVLSEDDFRKHFGYIKHLFTGIDYIEYYKSLIKEAGAEAEIIFSNNIESILKYTKDVLCCDIHTRTRTKRILKDNGANVVFGLDNILSAPVNNSGYNENYGLLGSNKATEECVKLFPRDCKNFVNHIQKRLFEKTGKKIEVMIYGDGAFKDPVGKIWELADPVVSPGYTDGLIGQPNELKLKYLADNDFYNLKGDELKEAIKNSIKSKDNNLKGAMHTQGTTPRNLTDLIGSLCDLTSGSGDKGTPIVYIQNYFTNYAEE